MNSSSLNEHLFLRNLVDSPNCLWGGETTSHIIFYTVPDLLPVDRNWYYPSQISNIPVNITITLFLFGTNELTDEQNTLIFVSIQKYIIKSKRFTPWSYGLPYFSDVHLASKLMISYHFSLLSIHYYYFTQFYSTLSNYYLPWPGFLCPHSAIRSCRVVWTQWPWLGRMSYYKLQCTSNIII
jgi:hypothetical protein